MPDQDDAQFDYSSIPIGYYDEVFRRNRGIQSKWHHTKFARIARNIHEGDRHLDIGCGPGTFIGTLPGEVASVGVDISSEQIEYAKRRYGGPGHIFQVVEPGPLPFDSGEFDVVTSIELIEHLTICQSRDHLSQAVRVLRPGGRLLLSTPNYGGFWPLLEWLLNRNAEVSYEKQHITHFRAKTLYGLLSQAGLSEIAVHPYQSLAPFAAALGWNFADRISQITPPWFDRRAGLLLLAIGKK